MTTARPVFKYLSLLLIFIAISCSNTSYVSSYSVSDTSEPECIQILKELSDHMHRVEMDSFKTDKPIYTFRFDVLTNRGKQMEAAYWTYLINWSNQIDNNLSCLEELTTSDIISMFGKPTFQKNQLVYILNFGDNCPCTRCGTDNLHSYLGSCELIKFSFNKEEKITNASILLTGFQFFD